ncbi:MAG: 5'/3'-nucleotidase SurE [Alphaproteobacteria bacterium]
MSDTLKEKLKKKSLRILISNDDSIYAPGIKVLEKLAREISDDVWVIAPAVEQSATAHSLTIHRPLRPKKIDDQKYAVDGTPTDCVLMAIKEIMKGKKPDLVLSGINSGANLADDVTYSGTVAAAMEATLLGVPAIALSQGGSLGNPIKWETAEAYGLKVIKLLVEEGWPEGVLINVNFPDVPPESIKGIEVARQGARPDYKSLIKAKDPRGLPPYYWIGPVPDVVDIDDESDLATVNKKKISITPLHLDLTHDATYARLVKKING